MKTPYEFAQLYWVLPFPIVNENNEVTAWDYARVDRYRLANRISAPGEDEKYDANTTAFLNEFGSRIKPFADKNRKEIKIYTKDADGAVKTEIFTRADERRLMSLAKKAIWGKGTPEQCQITLQLALRFGLATDVQTVRKFCEDGKIGLDCNGFVGAYMRDVLGMSVDHNTMIDALLKKGTAQIGSFDEINNQNTYVLGYVTTSGVVIAQKAEGKMAHVMITNPSPFDMIGVYQGKVYRRIKVVESTGGKGLVESDYLLLEEEKSGGKKTGVFKVYRGSQNQTMRVRIARVYI